MINIVDHIPGFIGGVSQQSPTLRLVNQAEEIINCHATIEDGLIKRPNTDFIKVIGSISASTGIKTHKINRDREEKYNVFLTTNSTDPIRIFDLDGIEMNVQYGYYDGDTFHADNSKKAYLTNGGITDAKEQIKAVSIADYTIIVNTQKTCEMTSLTSDGQTDVAFVYFKGCHKGQYRINYIYDVSGVQQNDLEYIDVVYVDGVLTSDTADLMEDFKAFATSPTYLTITGINNVLMVTPKATVDAGTLRVHVSDPYGGQDLIPINYCEVESVDKLPPNMPLDIVIKIGGDTEIQQDDYYMKSYYAQKRWVEDMGFGVNYELNSLTMPHRLMRTGVDEFTFAPIEWEERIVGDDDTNPVPSYIGEKINNATFAKNRLWLLSKDNAVGSKAGKYFDYFATTVMDILDGDPIDIAAASGQVANLRAGIMFDKGLLMFSDEEQFAMTSGDYLLTPKTVTMDGTTNFTADSHCDPLKLGSDVYFISPKGAYIAVREYTIMPDTLSQDAFDITAHVSKYIPMGDIMWAGCNQLDMIMLWSSTNADTMYTYKFLWDGAKKLQQAWYKWTFTDDIIGFTVFGTVMHILFYDTTNGYRLEKMNLENIPYTGQDFRYHIDSLQKYSNGVYSFPNTTFALDMNVGDGSDWVVIDASDNSEVTTGFTLVNSTLTFTNVDCHSDEFFIGRNYTMEYEFSQWYIKDDKGSAIISGITKIRNLILSFKDTGYFTLEVTPFNRDVVMQTSTDTMTGTKVNEAKFGAITLLTGEDEFLIMADSRGTVITLKSDSYLPVALQLGAWEGTYTARSKIL